MSADFEGAKFCVFRAVPSEGRGIFSDDRVKTPERFVFTPEIRGFVRQELEGVTVESLLAVVDEERGAFAFLFDCNITKYNFSFVGKTCTARVYLSSF